MENVSCQDEDSSYTLEIRNSFSTEPQFYEGKVPASNVSIDLTVHSTQRANLWHKPTLADATPSMKKPMLRCEKEISHASIVNNGGNA